MDILVKKKSHSCTFGMLGTIDGTNFTTVHLMTLGGTLQEIFHSFTFVIRQNHSR